MASELSHHHKVNAPAIPVHRYIGRGFKTFPLLKAIVNAGNAKSEEGVNHLIRKQNMYLCLSAQKLQPIVKI